MTTTPPSVEVINEAEGVVYVFPDATAEQAHALTGEPTFVSTRPVNDEDRTLLREAFPAQS